MSEGELKKRITESYVKEFFGSGELWYNYLWDDETEKQDDEKDVRNEAEERFYNIIDEAKNEFPKWNIMRAMPRAKYPSGEIVDVEASYRKEVLDWFIKQFGDST